MAIQTWKLNTGNQSGKWPFSDTVDGENDICTN